MLIDRINRSGKDCHSDRDVIRVCILFFSRRKLLHFLILLLFVLYYSIKYLFGVAMYLIIYKQNF